ncbi:MAG: nickel-dependent lactate racemase [Firmicutes bacterium]|nr:nickel-dependent lactate racemase [Bacillota bacterium]
MMILPYGKTGMPFEEGGAPVLRSDVSALKNETGGRELVRQALEHPIGSPRLRELAEGKKTCCFIISDHTRPVPSKDIVPEMLAEIRAGNPDIDITFLVATGCHRGTKPEELRAKLGDEIFESEKILVHDCDSEDNVAVGVLPSGAPLVLDKKALDAELLVAEGFIEPHFFAGFSGGRKSILPGICDRVTVLGNHCGAFIDSAFARTGILENNPIHEDMVSAVRQAGLDFIVNAIIDEDKKCAAAFAGDPIKAHEAGCRELLKYCQIKTKLYDIVVTTNGGAPLDQNFYQCVKCMTAAEAACREGGVVIALSECADGIGGDDFYAQMSTEETAQELYDRLTAVPRDKTEPDQWQSQIFARVLAHHTVIVVTRPELKEIVEKSKCLYAATADEALAMARALKGEGASLAVIPDGVSVMVKAEE